MKKKSILLDVDEVICFSGYIEAVNDFLSTSYKLDDFTEYYIDGIIPTEKMEAFNQFMKERNLYENAQILPYAIETIKALSEEYDIYICSACVNHFDRKNSGRKFMDKYNFLVENLPFIPPENFIFTSVKHLFQVDIQIDDRMENLQGNAKLKILFPSYHNQDISEEELQKRQIVRAGTNWREGWREVAKILLEKDKPKVYRKN